MLGLTIMVCIYAFILGSALASFFGVIIYRVPNDLSIIKPSSFCPNCKHQIKWYENVPVFSYIFLKGRCSQCKSKIGISSFIYELLGGIIFVLAFLAYGFSFETIFIILITAILYLIAGYDFKTKTILDIFWIIFLVLAVGLFLFRVFYLKYDFLPYLIGAGVGFAFFMLIKLIGKFILKNDCLGGGDVIIMAIAGLILKYSGLLLATLVASLVGSIIEITLIKMKKKASDEEIAFCPYLVLGILFALFYGEAIINFYLKVVL
ncbi:MAG: prepilin peptidase [Candidatus Caccosoma sp.]|nr:prepilin peptidase [Candidatus Caccosoma sp.]